MAWTRNKTGLNWSWQTAGNRRLCCAYFHSNLYVPFSSLRRVSQDQLCCMVGTGQPTPFLVGAWTWTFLLTASSPPPPTRTSPCESHWRKLVDRSQGTAGSRSIPQADLKSRLGRSRDCRIHVTMVLYCSTGDCIPTSASSNFGLIILQNSPPHKIDFSFLNFGIRR